MATQITFRRGTSAPTSGSGITLGEPAFDTSLKRFFIGQGTGVTAVWVGAQISGASSDVSAGLTYQIPTLAAVKNYVTDYVSTTTSGVASLEGLTGAIDLVAGTNIGISSAAGSITIINNGVRSFNGLTGAVGGVCAAQANTFSAYQTFTGGASITGLTAINGLYVTGAGIISNPDVAGGIELQTQTGYFAQDAYGNWTLDSNGTTIATATSNGFSIGAGVTFNVTDNTLLSGNVTVGNAATDVLTVTAGSTFGVTDHTGVARFASGVTVSGRLDVGGVLDVVGGATFESTTDHAGVARFASGVTFASSVDVTGAATFNGGLTASTIYASGQVRFVGNTNIGDQSTDTLTVFSGTTFSNRVDFGGTNVFRYGLTSGGGIRFSGNNAKTITTSEASLTITGSTSGPIASAYNSVVFGVQTTDPLTMYSATGVVDISTNNPLTPMQPALRFNTDDQDIIGPGSIKIEPLTYATAARTQYLQNASGTIALTSQLMGAVNGSTAATTAVTSFNGLTGAVGGVCAAQANTFTAVQTFNSGVTFASTTDHSGAARFASTVTATGAVTANGGLTASTIDVSGAARLASTLAVTGVLTQTGGATFASTTDHTGAARFASTVTATGAVTANGGLTASTLDVSGALRTIGDVSVGATLTVGGNLIVNGTTTTINSTTLVVDDKNIVLADGNTLDTGADGGGFTLKGASDKTFNWVDSSDSWTSSEHMDLAAGKVYKIGTTTVLSSNSLGSGVTGSSLTAVGTLTTGVWQATTVGVTYGGTGLTSYTIGDIIYASNTGTLAKLPSTTSGYLLASTGAGAAPEYKQLLIKDADTNTIASSASASGTLTMTIQNATTSVKGVAKFDSTNFTVTSGNVTITGIDGGSY